jgi:hypothetical protein
VEPAAPTIGGTVDCAEQAQVSRSNKETQMTKTKAKTLADLRAVHDDNVVIPKRIRDRFAAMLKIGPEEHDYEADFLKAAKVSNNKIGAFRQEFKAHIVVVGSRNSKRIWFADPKVASRFRAAIGASDDV